MAAPINVWSWPEASSSNRKDHYREMHTGTVLAYNFILILFWENIKCHINKWKLQYNAQTACVHIYVIVGIFLLKPAINAFFIYFRCILIVPWQRYNLFNLSMLKAVAENLIYAFFGYIQSLQPFSVRIYNKKNSPSSVFRIYNHHTIVALR